MSFTASAEEIITISGKVVDSRNRAMPQVNVRTVTGSIATVTNNDGVFLLKLPLSSEDDSIKFSSVGYLNRSIPVSEIESQQGEMVVELRPENLSIESINVDLKDATSYIEEVFRRREENYPLERTFQTAFYREMIKKRESFATLTEAVIEIDKSGLRSNEFDRVAIHKGRSLRDRRFTDTLFVKLQGGISSSMFLDVAKHSEIVFYDNPRAAYRFWFDKPTIIDGRKMMVVTFNQRGEGSDLFDYRGEIYVDSLTMGIARIEFNRNVEDHENSISAFIKRRPRDVKIRAMKAKYISSYRFIDGKWRFDYCSIDLDFRCHYKKRLFRNNYSIISEMVVTKREPEPKRIPYSLSIKTKDLMYDSVQEFYDEDFWESYNVIEHERSIDAVVKRFQRQLENR